MKNLWKDLARSTVISMGMAMAIFCIIGTIFDLSYGGKFSLDNYGFTKMVLGCVFIGLGFGIPSIVYRKDALPMPIRVIIHMGTGLVVYTIVAYTVGWIGGSTSIVQGALIALVQVAVAFVIWFLFMKHYKNEAKRINDKIQAMK